jgi:peptidoglycan/LPS O-acetylase OafA/YrhL
MPDEPKRIAGLDFLRGVASLAVCWFHLTSFRYPTPDGAFYEAVRASGAYGWLGVEVFFVISGFVIPYSLHRAGYRLRAYPTFILKRVIRLDPPYLVSIAVILGLGFAYAAYAGRAVEIEGAGVGWTRVLLHLGYLNMFFGHEWLNPAFWTLAIEFQYYLLMGLLFPLMSSRRRSLRLASLALFAAPSFFSGHGLLPGGAPISSFIFHFAFLFVLGVVLFQRRAGLAGRGEAWALLAASGAGALLTVGVVPTLAGLFAVAVISAYDRKNFVSDFFGNISYSLYLLHWPLGHLTLSLLGAKLLGADTDAEKALVLVAAHGVCFAASYLLFLLVERPAQRWSSRIRYGRRAATEETSALAPAAPPSAGDAAGLFAHASD